ncbi:MAG: hypothetical protein HOQ05_13460 [Corynebacteriales bacterium]|nr:hypothetical protein [Mycobacteriales bacterium]
MKLLNWRSVVMGAAALVTVSALTPGGVAHASAQTESGRVVKFIDHFFAPPPTPVADYPCTPKPGAVATIASAVNDVQGTDANDTVRGNAVGVYCLNVMPDDSITYDGSQTLTGTIDKCGTGSVTMEGHGTVTPVDPATGKRKQYGVWNIKPGTGTDGLVSVNSGGGVIYGDVDAVTLSDVGAFLGVVRC